MSSKLKILIAPLDWGLGHATRCLPIIGQLTTAGHSVSLAGPESLTSFIRQTFPQIKVLNLPGYGITYSKKRQFFAVKIMLQIPKILRAIKLEKKWLQQIQNTEDFDVVISDNRYGLYHPGIACVIMTHQLQVLSGKRNTRTDKILQKIHYRYLEKFDECWIVDERSKDNLGGKLSQPETVPYNARYIGILSQMSLFKTSTIANEKGRDSERKKILILLSGPEPMRSLLEKKLLKQCAEIRQQFEISFIAGKPAVQDSNQCCHKEDILYYERLSARQIFPLLQEADLVVCRSGYSTLMDLALLEKKALLIPTPGQTEQEYLASYLHKRFNTVVARQENIHLETDIRRALQSMPIIVRTTNPVDFCQMIKKLTSQKMNHSQH